MIVEKKLFVISLLIALFAGHTLIAQIPNPSFESWTGGNPDGWHTYNGDFGIITITQASPGHTGGYAAQGDTYAIPHTWHSLIHQAMAFL